MSSIRRIGIAASASAVTLLGACGSSSSDGPPSFPQPTVVTSQAGVLETGLQCLIAPNQLPASDGSGMVSVQTPTYEGTLTGPTLRVKPGDRMNISMFNSFPANPTTQRTGMMSFPHDPYTTNLHTHGLTVCPNGDSDNVLRRMPPQGDADFASSYPVQIDLPPYHQTGTFWYHPHKHGAVSFQFFGGMAGFLVVEGGPGTLDAVPEVAAAREQVMAFQAIRTDPDGTVPFVAQDANAFSSSMPMNGPSTTGVWDMFNGSNLWVTNNGQVNPTLYMQPGEVQRWRMLNAASGITLAVMLQGHSLNVIANDGLTVPEMVSLAADQPYVMGAGNRVDVMVQAGEPGTYKLMAVDPAAGSGLSVVYGNTAGGDPAPAQQRRAQIGADFPEPTWPVELATIVVQGSAISPPMTLPATALPVPANLPSVEQMLTAPLAAQRTVAFELCGQAAQNPSNRLPSCGWYFSKYDDTYWGGTYGNLAMMRDGDDVGVPNSDPDTMAEMPRIDYTTEGLFDASAPLFELTGGTFEEWTIENHTFSDHPFHIHLNPFLVTHVDGQALAVPQWHDTILIPAASGAAPPDINAASPGSITFRTWFDPNFYGCFVMHCHITSHEDVGMMQLLQMKPPGGADDCDSCPVPPVPPNF